MSCEGFFKTVGWLIRDTFKQARSSGLGTVAGALTIVATVACLSAEVHGERKFLGEEGQPVELLPAGDVEASKTKHDRGVKIVNNRLTLLFGRMEVPLARDADDAVRYLHYVFATGVCENFGVFLALIWTAGFLPAFLRPSNVTVLLTKPTPRWLLLFGKYLGVNLFVAVHAGAFVVCTWLALGLKTQAWNSIYLAAVPLLLVQFAAFFGFSVLLATLFRSSIASALGALLCWAACAGINHAHHAIWVTSGDGRVEAARAALQPQAAAANEQESAASTGAATSGGPKYHPALVSLVGASYWVLPKPIDIGHFVFRELRAGDFVNPPVSYEAIEKSGVVDLRLSIATSLGFAAFLLLAAAQQLRATDY